MNLKHVWIIFKKELKDTFRDRKTIIVTIVLPVLIIPLIMYFSMMGAKSSFEVKPEKTNIVLVNNDKANDFVKMLEDAQFNIMSANNPEKLLENGTILAIVEIPKGFSEKIEKGQKASITIKIDNSNPKSSSAMGMLNGVISSYSKLIVQKRLIAKNIDPGIIDPIEINQKNIAPPQKETASFLAILIPAFLVIWVVNGGMNAAIDVTAGEKERKTLEPLLTTSASRISIITGKYLLVALMSTISGVCGIIGYVPTVLLLPKIMGNGNTQIKIDLSIEIVLLLLLSLVLTAIIFSALQVAIASYARSFKEGGTYLSPFSIIVLIPMFLTMYKLPNEIPMFYFAIPIMNSISVIKEFMYNTVNVEHFTTFLFSSIVYIIISIRFAASMFENEKVLFRT